MNPSNTQEARVALITGAARRIGAGIATHLHELGFQVIIHCHHSTTDANALAKRLNQKRPNSAHVIHGDLNQSSTLHSLIPQALKWNSRLDLLVNNASLFSRNDDDWDQLFQVNVKAPYQLSHAAFDALSKHNGSIINLTDAHLTQPLKGYEAYSQTKAALTMQTKALAHKFSPKVRVNAVAPGAILWPEHDNMLTPTQQDTIIQETPLKRHGDPLFIAQAIQAFIDNPFITGQTLCVDGGRF